MSSFEPNANHLNKVQNDSNSQVNKMMLQNLNVKQGRTFNVLIGCTGSVASLKIPKLVEELLNSKFKVI